MTKEQILEAITDFSGEYRDGKPYMGTRSINSGKLAQFLADLLNRTIDT